MPSTSLTPGAPLGPLMVTSRRWVGFHIASGSTETEHFMWLKEHSSSQALAAARDCSEPVLMASLSRVLTPGSTASEID